MTGFAAARQAGGIPKRLLAISDLHLRYPAARQALAAVPDHGDDWLIVAGDVGEGDALLALAIRALRARFARVLWVPGNHELWTDKASPGQGEARYSRAVDIVRSEGGETPEDPFPRWQTPDGDVRIALLFVGYDRSFRPPEISEEQVLAWAGQQRIVATDEWRIEPETHGDVGAWCAARVASSVRRLEEDGAGLPTVLVNHWPLRVDLVRIPRVPRFLPWCGTTRTEDWHRRYRAIACVHGHLHVRATDWRDGVRFEEVSLGYPRQWDPSRSMESYMREILPASGAVPSETARFWR